jgi:hypothetical protein
MSDEPTTCSRCGERAVALCEPCWEWEQDYRAQMYLAAQEDWWAERKARECAICGGDHADHEYRPPEPARVAEDRGEEVWLIPGDEPLPGGEPPMNAAGAP